MIPDTPTVSEAGVGASGLTDQVEIEPESPAHDGASRANTYTILLNRTQAYTTNGLFSEREPIDLSKFGPKRLG